MKTHIETIRGNIAALERRLRRTKSPSARQRIAQTIGQWTFLLQRAEREEMDAELVRLDAKFKPWTDAIAASQKITEEDLRIVIT